MPDSTTIKVFQSCTNDRWQFNELNKTLDSKEPYEFIFLNDFTPNDLWKRYKYLKSLDRSGCDYSLVVITHSSGDNVRNLHFVWRVLHTEYLENILGRSQKVIEEAKHRFPKFYTRAMNVEKFTKCGRISRGVKLAVLRHFDQSLTGGICILAIHINIFMQ